MGSIAFLDHEIFLSHRNPKLHPEGPERLEAINRALAESDVLSRIVRIPPRSATADELCGTHSADYIEKLEKISEELKQRGEFIQLDVDTFMSASSYDAAKLAAGAGIVAVESVQSDRFGCSFVAARPPGHHARIDRQMGFCIINNVALAARYAREKLGYKRVAVIDWDVHHGNGTQEIFYEDPSVCVLSLHQFPFWPPGSGWYTEDGSQEGKGYNVNIPLPAATGDRGYLSAWDRIVMPVCLQYNPDLIILSAGYDAHQLDPQGEQQVTTAGFAGLSEKLFELSSLTGAKVVAFLEGGYNLRALSESVVATLRVLSAESSIRLDEVRACYADLSSGRKLRPVTNDRNPQSVEAQIDEVRRYYAQYWSSLKGMV